MWGWWRTWGKWGVVGVTDDFKVGVELHQRSEPFLICSIDGQADRWDQMGVSSFGGCSENIEQVEVCSGDKSNESLWSKTRIHVCVNKKEALLTVKMHEVEAVKMLKGRTVHKRGQEASAGRVELGVVEMSAWNNLWQKDSSKTEREDVQEWDLVCLFFFVCFLSLSGLAAFAITFMI